MIQLAGRVDKLTKQGRVEGSRYMLRVGASYRLYDSVVGHGVKSKASTTTRTPRRQPDATRTPGRSPNLTMVTCHPRAPTRRAPSAAQARVSRCEPCLLHSPPPSAHHGVRLGAVCVGQCSPGKLLGFEIMYMCTHCIRSSSVYLRSAWSTSS